MKKDFLKTSIIILLIVIAALSRLIPHPSNFTAIGAIAIFSAFLIGNRFMAIIIPFMAMWLSDLILNNVVYPSEQFTWFTVGTAWIYAGMATHCIFAWLFKKPTAVGILGASIAGAVSFFILSNIGMWVGSGLYAHTTEGLVLCFTAALPFFGNVLAGNIIFSFVLFGVFNLLEKRTQAFQTI